MNKYSKRALKTTATVGMSLAMVLSGVAAPVTKISAVDATCATIAEKTAAELLVDSIKADIKAAGYTLDNLPKDATKTDADTPGDIAWTNTKAVGTDVAAGQSIETVLEKKSTTFSSFTLAELIAALTEDGCSADYKKDAEKLAGFVTGVTDYKAAMGDLVTALAPNGKLNDGVITTADWDAQIKALYDKVIKNEGYKNNMETTVTDETKATYKNNIVELKELVEDYTNTYVNKFVKAYVEKLEAVKIKDKTVKALVNDSTTDFSRDDLKALEDTIKDIKEDKIAALTNTGVTYAQVGEEDEVAEYVEGLEAIVDEIKEVNDLLKSNTASQKALKAIKTKVGAVVTATKLTVGSNTSGGEVSADAKEAAITRAMNDFRAEDLENLTTYVEDFFNEFYTVTVKQRANGNYSVDLDPTNYVRYFNGTDDDAFDQATGVGYLLATLVEKDADETYYDALVGNVNDAEKLMKAVAAVEDIRLGSNFTTAEANKIVAARKAFAELDVNGSNPYGLTAKERRTVKANDDLITALYTKLILSGTITESGWIDKGNGNWDYINADGSKSTKWVAAGKDWYFVQNGTMLRSAWVAQDSTGAKWYYVDNAGKMVSNTTIDGFVIDANGVWTK